METRQGEQGKASEKQIVAFGARDSAGNAVVTASGSAGNPLNNPNPPITYNFTINAEPSGSTFSLTGSYGGYPSMNVTATNEQGQTLGVYNFDESNSPAGPLTLTGAFGQQQVNEQCQFGGSPGCQEHTDHLLW